MSAPTTPQEITAAIRKRQQDRALRFKDIARYSPEVAILAQPLIC